MSNTDLINDYFSCYQFDEDIQLYIGTLKNPKGNVRVITAPTLEKLIRKAPSYGNKASK